MGWCSDKKWNLAIDPTIWNQIETKQSAIISPLFLFLTIAPNIPWLLPWNYTCYICSIALSRLESNDQPGWQGSLDWQSLFWEDRCFHKYSVIVEDEKMLGTASGLCCYHLGRLSPLFFLFLGHRFLTRSSWEHLKLIKNIYHTLLYLPGKIYLSP